MSVRSRNNSENTVDSRSYDTDISVEHDTSQNPHATKPIPISSIKNKGKRQRDQPIKLLEPSPVPDKEKHFSKFTIENIKKMFENSGKE
jgi:hypothetical protein